MKIAAKWTVMWGGIGKSAKCVREEWRSHAAGLTAALVVVVTSLAALAVVQAIELRRQNPLVDWGSVSDAFAAIGTISAVVVALRQSAVARTQAEEGAKEARDRFDRELAAAEERHQRELQAQREVTALEVQNQANLARVQRLHIREQDYKNALIRVSRTVGAYTHELATLIEVGLRAVRQPATERSGLLHDVSEHLGRHVQDFSAELAGAHMLTQNENIHESLNRVNAAVEQGPMAEMAFRNVVMSVMSNPEEVKQAARPLFVVMAEMQTRLGDARQLAGNILVAGWD